MAITGNGYDFSLTSFNTIRNIISAGASITIANSTVATVDASGADAPGDGQAGGAIHLINTSAGAIIANGGDSTDYGYGGAAGTTTLDFTSSVTARTAHAGSNGPNLHTGQQSGGGGGGSGSSSVPGCIDPSASNYNSSATVDNGSCHYPSSQVPGCTNPSASNYNSSATVNDGSCTYPSYTPPYIPPSGGGGDSGGGDEGGGGGDVPPFNGVSISTATFGGSLILHPLPLFTTDVARVGDTVLGNPLAGLNPLGSLNLLGLKFSFALPISEFLFAPLPKAITDALSKAPKFSDVIASVGISHAQDLVKLVRQAILLPKGGSDVPGLFIVSLGTTTLDTFVTNDRDHNLVELVRARPGDVLNIELIPLSKGKVTAQFDGETLSFFQSSQPSFVNAVVTAPQTPGRYILTTASAPLPLAIDVVAPEPPPAPKPLPWWKKVWHWFRGV